MSQHLISITHPSWCTHCSAGDPDITEHRGLPAVMRSSVDDASLAVFPVQIDAGACDLPFIGEGMVRITITDLVRGRVIGADLSPADARTLANALVEAATEVETEHQRIAHTKTGGR